MSAFDPKRTLGAAKCYPLICTKRGPPGGTCSDASSSREQARSGLGVSQPKFRTHLLEKKMGRVGAVGHVGDPDRISAERKRSLNCSSLSTLSS